jgi:Predicted membrane protein
METHFGEIHRKECGVPPPSNGYPDHGNGRYSEKLSYKDWFMLNNSYRAHSNFVESLGVIIPATLIGGIGFPKAATILGWTYFLGRIIYTIGYHTMTPTNRYYGYSITLLCTFALLGFLV